MKKDMYMYPKFGEAAMWCGVAEEAAELSAAASKMVRILSGDNPTPVGKEEGLKKCAEEYTDLLLYTDELGLCKDKELSCSKYERGKIRWEEFIKDRHSNLLRDMRSFGYLLLKVSSSLPEEEREDIIKSFVSLSDSMEEVLFRW